MHTAYIAELCTINYLKQYIMNNRQTNIDKQELAVPKNEQTWKAPQNIDTPKPDPETVGSNEEEDEVVKPGGNIFE